MKPTSLSIRSYDVGFGDCFLLTFHYPNRDRHVLIDFGSMETPTGKIVNGKPITSGYLKAIANEIAKDCGGTLDIVVATHRHQDHISGFTRSKGKGPGEIIRNLKPKFVIQPWTEDPDAAEDATEPTKSLHVRTLAEMQSVAAYAASVAKTLRGERFANLRKQLDGIGMDNIKNPDAVENLQTMAPNKFVYHKCPLKLGRLLPDVTVTVLGPPTVKQTDTILKQRREDKDEFWHLNGIYWRRLAATTSFAIKNGGVLFSEQATKVLPRSAGWFKYTVQKERAESTLSIVRSLDKAMNNTSVILLFQVNGKSILFPGDAQYENWMYALEQKDIMKQLAAVDLYKVGHHGSLNATPKTLWNNFAQKGGTQKKDRLQTLLSTKPGVHGSVENKSEVPRKVLVDEMLVFSDLMDTSTFKCDELSRLTSIAL